MLVGEVRRSDLILVTFKGFPDIFDVESKLYQS
jgi:hypothetical protein